MTWIAIDVITDKIVGIGNQSDAQLEANRHKCLSGNTTIVRLLRVGMTIKDYE